MLLHFPLIIPLDHKDLEFPHQVVHDPVIQMAPVITLQHLLLHSKIPRKFICCLGQKLLQIRDHKKTSDKIFHSLRIRVSEFL